MNTIWRKSRGALRPQYFNEVIYYLLPWEIQMQFSKCCLRQHMMNINRTKNTIKETFE